MSTPVLEIALAPVRGRTISDESTPDGEIWREIFSHVTNIPGLIRASWGLNQLNRDLNLFLVDWESYPHHERFMDEQGTLSKPIMDLMSDDFNMYHIQTPEQSRDWLKAPITLLSFYVVSNADHIAEPLRGLIDGYKKCSGLVQVVTGDARNPPRHNSQGWMKNGQSVAIVLSGWASPEDLGNGQKSPQIKSASKHLDDASIFVMSFPVTFTVVEHTRYEHSWRRLPLPTLKDVPLRGQT